jgi:hypothetical protein
MIHHIQKLLICQVISLQVTNSQVITSQFTCLHKIRFLFAVLELHLLRFHGFLSFYSRYAGSGILNAHVLRTGAFSRPSPPLLWVFL